MSFLSKTSKTDVSQSDVSKPRRLTDEEKKALNSYWDIFGAYITDHEGVPNEDMKSTVNIKNDILLVHAIHEIRDGYFELEKQMHDSERKRTVVSMILKTPHNRRINDIQSGIEREMIAHNADSLQRLQDKDYGFKDEQKKSILKSAPETTIQNPPGLSEEDALVILGHIIHKSLYSMAECLQEPEVAYVPRTFKPGIREMEMGMPHDNHQSLIRR